jgi:lysine/ornithine N-monooxygenase
VSINEVTIQRVEGKVSRARDIVKALRRPAQTYEWLDHLPLRGRIEESKFLSRSDVRRREYRQASGIHQNRRTARVIQKSKYLRFF